MGSLSEKELQRNTLILARLRGWICAHFGNTVKIVHTLGGYKTIPDPDAKGFPDFIGIRDGKLLVLEFKGEKGKVSPEQAIWIAQFREAGIEAQIVRPADWDKIVGLLT